MQLQTSLALVQGGGSAKKPVTPDVYGRTPFTHPALDGLDNLSSYTKGFLTSKWKLADLARSYELQNVVRWSPRVVSDAFNCLCGSPC